MNNQIETSSKTNKANPSQRDSNYSRNCPFPIPQDRDTTEKLKNSFQNKCTVSNLIYWASRILQECRIDSPRLDAEVILSHLLGCERIHFYLHPDKPVEDTIAVDYKKAIQRRAQRVPVQYITNYAEFMSLGFYVDERVLIPRPETELLVEAVMKRTQSFSKEHEIVVVDIGVGSGNIAITLATKIDNARIFAIDISPDALEVAKANAQKHQVLDKITFLCGDTFKQLEGYELESKVSFIVSNPPYVASHEFSALQEEVRDFEPYMAIVSGQDGLQMFKRIIANSNIWLKPNGFIAFEVGEKQAQKVAWLLKGTGYFKKSEFIKDYQHIHRIVIAQMEKDCVHHSH